MCTGVCIQYYVYRCLHTILCVQVYANIKFTIFTLTMCVSSLQVYTCTYVLLKVRNAFAVMDLVPEQVQEVMSVLSGILHLGNLTFVAAAGAQIGNKASLDAVANLLSLDSYRLGDALTKKFMVLRGEEITTPLTVEQVSWFVIIPIVKVVAKFL